MNHNNNKKKRTSLFQRLIYLTVTIVQLNENFIKLCMLRNVGQMLILLQCPVMSPRN